MSNPNPLFEQLSEGLAQAIESALDGRNPNLPRLQAPNADAARQDLDQIRAHGKSIDSASTPDGWASALDQWRNSLSSLASHGMGPSQGLSAVLVRALQESAPRAANLLGATGVISSPSPGRMDVDFPKLQALLSTPDSLLDESRWNALQAPAGAKAALTALAAAEDESSIVGILWHLALLAETKLALDRDGITLAPFPVMTPQPGTPWSDFRAKTAQWLSFTIASADSSKPVNQQSPRSLFDIASGIEPNRAMTVAIRSNRTTLNGKPVTGFELWWLLTENGVPVDRPTWEYDGGDGWKFRIEPGISAGFGYDGNWHGSLRPVSQANLPPSPDDPVVVSFGRDTTGDEPDIVLGPPGDTQIIVKDIGLYLKVRNNDTHPVFELGGFAHGFSLVLTNRWWRTFGATSETFGSGLRFDLDLELRYVEGKGLLLNLDAGLDVTFHINSNVISGSAEKPFSIKIHSIRLRVPVEATSDDFRMRLEVMFHASIQMGPLLIVLDGLGAWVGYWPEPPEIPYVGLIAPHGVGMEITLPMVTGGGFLDFTGGPNERFGGLLHLKIAPLEVVAFGLHELIGPPSQPNRKTSVIMVLGVRFSPGIQLGFGLSITGVGGIVGINRRADADALRERLTSGGAGNLLFAEDPVSNAPALLGDLNAIFPAADGVYVVGPTLQIAWLRMGDTSFARLDIGIILEFPGPSKLIIIGSLRAAIPKAEKMLRIRLDLIGVFDFQKKLIAFDATLINSEALSVFTLTGDAALRASYGDHPYFGLAVGGFHPHFTPEPANFPEMTRVALTMKKSEQTKNFFLRIEAYVAVTSNSVQFGAAIEVGVYLGPLNIVGFLRLDVLFQFSPFYFEVSISAGIRVRFGTTTLLGVRLEGVLSGPGPFLLSGTFAIEILFFEIPFSATIRLGEGAAAEVPEPIASVAQELKPELSDPKNLSATGGGDAEVSLQTRSSSRALVSPLGGLVWTQRRAPLNLLMDRFDGQPLSAPQALSLEANLATGTVQDWFSPGSFANLSESEGLNRPSFERLNAGVSLGFADAASGTVVHHAKVIEIRLPHKQTVDAFSFSFLLFMAIFNRNGLSIVPTTAPKITVTDPQFIVRGPDGSMTHSACSLSEAFQRARATGGCALAANDMVEISEL